MLTASQIAFFLFGGAIGGGAWIAVAHAVPRYTRHILAGVLVAAAVCYVAFAARGDAGPGWIAAEMAGVGIYAALAVSGVRGSPWWLVAGWALHPVWDVPLHLFGGGHAFAPAIYPVGCMSWDWLTAAYLAYRTVREWSGVEGRAIVSLASSTSRRPDRDVTTGWNRNAREPLGSGTGRQHA